MPPVQTIWCWRGEEAAPMSFLCRRQAFAAAGADVLFIDALESEDEMRAFTRLGGAAAGVPKVGTALKRVGT